MNAKEIRLISAHTQTEKEASSNQTSFQFNVMTYAYSFSQLHIQLLADFMRHIHITIHTFAWYNIDEMHLINARSGAIKRKIKAKPKQSKAKNITQCKSKMKLKNYRSYSCLRIQHRILSVARFKSQQTAREMNTCAYVVVIVDYSGVLLYWDGCCFSWWCRVFYNLFHSTSVIGLILNRQKERKQFKWISLWVCACWLIVGCYSRKENEKALVFDSNARCYTYKIIGILVWWNWRTMTAMPRSLAISQRNIWTLNTYIIHTRFQLWW